jgi:hypothetical protein
MLEFARNQPIDAEVLAGLFARCGWEDEGAGVKLKWALAASEEWVVCKLDGELIGFGRSCRLGPVKRVMFDVMVDPRYDHPVVRRQIVRLLAQNAGRLEEVSVFGERRPDRLAEAEASQPRPGETLGHDYTGGGPALHVPAAPPNAYLGANKTTEEDR